MASSVSAFACTIPAGTSSGSPHVVALGLSPDPIVSIHWRVPPGPRGHVGWWLTQSGVQVLPDRYGTALVADGESDTWVLNDFPESGAWALVGYNTGINDHVVYLEFTHEPTVTGTTLTGDILTGFPISDADIPTMWLAQSGGALA
jgi:hypothetical protein